LTPGELSLTACSGGDSRDGSIPRIGFHVLRHTHGSIVAAATRDVRAVQRRLRHTSASFTLETYIHLLDDRIGVDAVTQALEAFRVPGQN
jgi:integrase